ncbi:MAG TPA: hypothetical protein VMZ53_15915 [Kofleriaceae bacterium]|nr:hypothetical protein [Kofleriaceae bacterium]
MRRALVLIALAACELQPAPKKQPVPVEVVTPPPQPVQAPVVVDAGAAASDAEAPPPIIQASADCINVAAHVVQVFISTARDQAQAAVYEQERMKMTRATAEACEKQQWSTAAQKCYLASKNPAEIKACENKFPPPPPEREGNGSAVVKPTNEPGGPAVPPR